MFLLCFYMFMIIITVVIILIISSLVSYIIYTDVYMYRLYRSITNSMWGKQREKMFRFHVRFHCPWGHRMIIQDWVWTETLSCEPMEHLNNPHTMVFWWKPWSLSYWWILKLPRHQQPSGLFTAESIGSHHQQQIPHDAFVTLASYMLLKPNLVDTLR